MTTDCPIYDAVTIPEEWHHRDRDTAVIDWHEWFLVRGFDDNHEHASAIGEHGADPLLDGEAVQS